MVGLFGLRTTAPAGQQSILSDFGLARQLADARWVDGGADSGRVSSSACACDAPPALDAGAAGEAVEVADAALTGILSKQRSAICSQWWRVV